MSRRTASVSIAAAVLLLVAGCQTPQGTMVECASPVATVRSGPALVGAAYGMQLAPIPLDAVLWTDKAAAHAVALQSMSARRTPTESVQVAARFFNCSDRALVVRARVSFMDANQVPTEQPSIWKPVHLAPGSSGVFVENSIGRQNVAHYLIEISSDR
jgi:hypothetical protein